MPEPAGMEVTLRVAMRVAMTRAEGPFERFALWVQGCSIRCRGCCNPGLFSTEGGVEVAVETLLDEVRSVRDRIEGVTLLGGEPFEQAAPLSRFARGARELGLGVMTFTGFTWEELSASTDPAVRELLALTDLLVDGRYDASRRETARRWAGSTNQRFFYVSDRYPTGLETVGPGEPAGTVELRIGVEGTVAVSGWPELWSSLSQPARSTRVSSSGTGPCRSPLREPASRSGT